MECEIEAKEVATNPELLVLFGFFIKILSKIDRDEYVMPIFIFFPEMQRFIILKKILFIYLERILKRGDL